jgi:ferrous iron transport protein B
VSNPVPVIALAGLKGVGKTRLLQRLGHFDHPEQYQSTLEPAETSGVLPDGRGVVWIDTPALSSLFSAFETEKTTRNLLLSDRPDRILFVAQIHGLLRSIALFNQLTLLEKPMVVAVTGLERETDSTLDEAAMARDLGCPVVCLGPDPAADQARLLEALAGPPVTPALQLRVPRLAHLRQAHPGLDALSDARLLLSCLPDAPLAGLSPAEARAMQEAARDLARHNPFLRNDLYLTDLSFQLAARHLAGWKRPLPSGRRPSWGERFGLWAQRPATGIPVVLGLLALMYVFVGLFGAQILVEWMDRWLFAPVLEPFFLWFTQLFPSAFVQRAVLDPDFGLLPTGLFLVLGIVFPVLLTYYIFIGFLESAGYFPRLSVLLDRAMRPMGLNGRGVMPLIMGLSCVTMAIMTTRMLESRKEKIIASFLLVLGMPCAPLLSTMFIILGQLPFAATLLLFGILLSQIFVGGWLANKLVSGQQSELIMEIPPVTLPDPRWVLRSAWVRTWLFMKEAIPFFLAASFLLFLLNEAGAVSWLGEASAPLVENFWGLPKESVQVFIKTMIRRENGVAELAHLKAGFTGNQLLITLLIMTFLMPCVNATFMLFKERGARVALLIIGTVLVYTTLVGGAVNFGLRLLGVQW